MRDEEAEAQRKARSRRERQARRSTQGVTLGGFLFCVYLLFLIFVVCYLNNFKALWCCSNLESINKILKYIFINLSGRFYFNAAFCSTKADKLV